MVNERKRPGRRQFLAAALAAPAVACRGGPAEGPSNPARRAFVVVNLRGGVDGLSMVPPRADAAFARARRGSPGAPPLDGRFGLHPSLASLLPLWHLGSLAVVHAVGTPGPVDHGASQRALRRAASAFSEGIKGGGFEELMPIDLAAAAEPLARRLATSNKTPWVEVGGWDTHADQDARLGRGFRELSDFLTRLAKALGPQLAAVQIVVVSEFGRSIALNAGRGTDHGGATAMLLLGGSVPGGRIYGEWPGIDGAPTLRATANVGDVLAEIASLHGRPGAPGPLPVRRILV